MSTNTWIVLTIFVITAAVHCEQQFNILISKNCEVLKTLPDYYKADNWNNCTISHNAVTCTKATREPTSQDDVCTECFNVSIQLGGEGGAPARNMNLGGCDFDSLIKKYFPAKTEL
mmetsp:Transcript_1920/g.2486  ORF Transcript_1920/g.2486 Transcript_1920/m.2486 type:complete len:116 (+) Transcript_1920:127-474(+)